MFTQWHPFRLALVLSCQPKRPIHANSMKLWSALLVICLLFTGKTFADNISGTWEGFVSSSATGSAYVRLHIDAQGGYLLRSVPYGQANATVVPFHNTDISSNDGIVRIVATEPPINNQSRVETVITFSIRQNPVKESRHVSAAIGSMFEYLLSPKEGRIPFCTYAFELNDVQGISIIDAIAEAIEKYEQKSNVNEQINSASGAGAPHAVR